MEEGKPSRSAIFAAMTRAADNFALRFSGVQDETSLLPSLNAIHAMMERGTSRDFARAFSQSYRAFAVVRHRYTEDELGKALERGVSQYVILGAGLDSFAYRRRDLKDKLRVYEVDFPATQQWKKARLHELNISLSNNLTFVPVDFEKQILMNELLVCGYQKDTPAFFSWLGVTQYLTEKAVFQTLDQIASAAPGSEIVFEYILPESLLNKEEKRVVARGKARPKSDEPWISQFAPAVLAQRLQEMGFTYMSDFGQEEANALYLGNRTDELSTSALEKLSFSMLRLGHFMKAKVAGRHQ
jgi:methyltransferase (TIGR00027 family)